MRRIGCVLAGLAMITATGIHAQSWQRITGKDAFVSTVQGKTLSSNGSTATINSDGSTYGTLAGGNDYVGKWVWDNGRYCRNLVIGGDETGTFCAHIDIAGNQVRFSNLGANPSESVWMAR